MDRCNIVSDEDLRQTVQKTEARLNNTPAEPPAVVDIENAKQEATQ